MSARGWEAARAGKTGTMADARRPRRRQRFPGAGRLRSSAGRALALAGLLLTAGLAGGCGGAIDPSLPVYTLEQSDSSHAGYRRTVVSSGDVSFVNDFEEQSLQPAEVDPKRVVGRTPLGGGGIRAIAGQDPSAYLAVDVGSEMPAYEVFRNTAHPPFDWRTASFQRMRLARPDGPTANRETTDPALIEEVLRTLREGAPTGASVTPPEVTDTAVPVGVYGVRLFSDQLPGLIFRPSCYVERTGRVYLAEGMLLTFTRTERSVRADWIPAGPGFSRWVQTP